MTGSDIISRVREILRDENTPYRWSDSELFNYINDGVVDIRQLFPESKLDSNGDIQDFTEVDELTDTVPLDDIFRLTLVNYVAYRSFQKDSDETHDANRAREHYQLFLSRRG